MNEPIEEALAHLRELATQGDPVAEYAVPVIERLTHERDEAWKFMHINADAVDALQADRERLRAIISNVDGMLFDGADSKRIRAYLQREALRPADEVQK